MNAKVTKAQEEELHELWHAFLQRERKTGQLQSHLEDALLYDLALGELPPVQQEEVHGHLADCQLCVNKLIDIQATIVTDKKVRATWAPKVLHAAGNEPSRSVISALTEGEEYQITLQPTRDGQKDLLTLEVTPSFQQDVEGCKIVVFSAGWKIILSGAISGGNITRLVDRKFREEWPFRVHAG
ncbi:MAG: hypothetical protein HY268_31870 [Deltaproteobacteria bacterium]|nr:hypothetical protein [Deltaproteobacteria bacterium]